MFLFDVILFGAGAAGTYVLSKKQYGENALLLKGATGGLALAAVASLFT